MRLLAIDPGNLESALLVYETDTGQPQEWVKCPNEEALELVATWEAEAMAVEMIASYGMAVGASVFATCVWIGRFVERWNVEARARTEPELVFRSEAKMHLCRSIRAKDANIRQALIDRYGGKQQAIGLKATPGPLYGLSGDCWSALAVAVTVAGRAPVQDDSQLMLV
jgi:hypothetical protein